METNEGITKQNLFYRLFLPPLGFGSTAIQFPFNALTVFFGPLRELVLTSIVNIGTVSYPNHKPPRGSLPLLSVQNFPIN